VVKPGDILNFEVKVSNVRLNIGKGIGKATVNGELVCTAELLFSII
jgi:3-hydroxyacyl-[acyl-carrier-protein] dehydratase